MSKDETTPIGNPLRHRGEITLDDRLGAIEETLKAIMDKIDGLPIRVRALEIVVYTGCGVVLLAVLGAVTAFFLRTHP